MIGYYEKQLDGVTRFHVKSYIQNVDWSTLTIGKAEQRAMVRCAQRSTVQDYAIYIYIYIYIN